MIKQISGESSGKNLEITIVVSKFNEHITQRLLDGCLDELSRLDVLKKNITVVWVPGAFEIPVVAARCAKKKTCDAVICLGAIIRGETFHYELVANESARGIMNVSLESKKPVIFEILAADTVELLNKRSKVKGQNKGRSAAQVAVETANVLSKI